MVDGRADPVGEQLFARELVAFALGRGDERARRPSVLARLTEVAAIASREGEATDESAFRGVSPAAIVEVLFPLWRALFALELDGAGADLERAKKAVDRRFAREVPAKKIASLAASFVIERRVQREVQKAFYSLINDRAWLGERQPLASSSTSRASSSAPYA